MSYPSPLLASLGAIVHEAGALAVQMRKAGLSRELKADGSIVTPIDVAVEVLLRKSLTELYPDTNVWGEELGFEDEGEGGLWLVDPIDGTSNFSYGGPLWGISVALVRQSQLELGAIFLPDLGETYLAERGRGAFLNGSAISPIAPGPVRPEEIVAYDERLLRMYDREQLPGKMRCCGAFVVEGTFVVKQRWRGLIGYREKLYDAAASILLALEVGAEVRYVDGSPFVIGDLICDAKIEKPWMIFPAESGFQIPG